MLCLLGTFYNLLGTHNTTRHHPTPTHQNNPSEQPLNTQTPIQRLLFRYGKCMNSALDIP